MQDSSHGSLEGFGGKRLQGQESRGHISRRRLSYFNVCCILGIDKCNEYSVAATIAFNALKSKSIV